MIVNDLEFIAAIAVYFKQPVINAVEKELSQEPPETKEVLSPSDLSPPASAETRLDEKSKDRRSRRRRQDQKSKETVIARWSRTTSARRTYVHLCSPPGRMVP